MSRQDYITSREIEGERYPFYAIIFALKGRVGNELLKPFFDKRSSDPYAEMVAEQVIVKRGYSVAALVMAAMRQADSDNIEILKETWPHLFYELKERYNASGGYLDGENLEIEF